MVRSDRQEKSIQKTLQSWFELGDSKHRSLPMEGLRGLAILLVFICHYQLVICSRYPGAVPEVLARLVTQFGGTGVDLFFLLSGMLIYKAALRQDLRLRSFWARRAERIYPTFLVALALYVAVLLLTHSDKGRLSTGTTEMFMTIAQNVLLLPGIFDKQPIISAAWSLSYEWMFYLVLPILVLSFGLGRWTVGGRLMFFSCIGAAHVLIVLLWHHSFEHYQFQERTLIRFLMFIAGIVVYEALQKQVFLKGRFNRILCVSTVAAVLCFGLLEMGSPALIDRRSSIHQVIRVVVLFGGYVGLSLLAMQQRGQVKNYFSLAPLRWLGNISFSFYLIHGLVLNAIAIVLVRFAWISFHPRLILIALFVPALATTFGVSSILFLAVERPFSLTKKSRRSSIAAAAPEPSRHSDLTPQLTVEAG